MPAPLPGEPRCRTRGPKPGDIITQTRTASTTRRCGRLYVVDSRDNPFEPTRGQRCRLAVEYAGGFLGGDNYFIRPELTFSMFQPVSDYPDPRRWSRQHRRAA